MFVINQNLWHHSRTISDLRKLCPILSVAMMLRYSLNQENLADKIEAAVNRVLDQGYRTQDIAGDGNSVVGTREMGDLVVEALA
jgi:3-isopropylmalate dehydrogenase